MTRTAEHARRGEWFSPDGRRILAARLLRTFGFGYLAVVLAAYLAALGKSPIEVGAVLTTTIAGTATATVLSSLWADRLGRRRTLVALSVLMTAGGLIFAAGDALWLLLLGAFTGAMSVSGSDIGPANTIDQAILPQTTTDARRTRLFSYYTMAGNLAAAVGALFAGTVAFFARLGLDGADAYRPLFVVYALIGVGNALLLGRLTAAVEVPAADAEEPARPPGFLGVHRSRSIVVRLSLLYGLDSFAGGFTVQSLVAYWFTLRWHLSPEALGALFFADGLLSGASLLVAGRLAERFGLLRTMVFTQLPSNLLLILLPLAPSTGLAMAVFLARSSISQMDIPTRQSYNMAIVEPDERTATAGITNVARTAAGAAAPLLSGYAYSIAALGAPFFFAGALKVVYNVLIYRAFRHIHPPEERLRREAGDAG
ncbi:MFS transporter [Acrocarpospora macrocephala]|uniref:MFS transporter n=1 Tax=Acrocarpospora macrocephala TaxID=150177 RepID=A0A5M3WG40_9ACTN|nr:MFS transporter [Acrocarpospora macrocephala]GES07082.1 MFS transporter [Acrocarpospora macrocephala]